MIDNIATAAPHSWHTDLSATPRCVLAVAAIAVIALVASRIFGASDARIQKPNRCATNAVVEGSWADIDPRASRSVAELRAHVEEYPAVIVTVVTVCQGQRVMVGMAYYKTAAKPLLKEMLSGRDAAEAFTITVVGPEMRNESILKLIHSEFQSVSLRHRCERINMPFAPDNVIVNTDGRVHLLDLF